MKRIHLRLPGTGGIHIPTLRDAAVAIATWAVDGNRGRGLHDPVHEFVTEGRRAQYEKALAAKVPWALKMEKAGAYASCGDLAHALLMLLGVRDERVLNRGDEGGRLPWYAGPNISRLVRSPWYVSASENGLPEPGDILHVSGPHHVSVLIAKLSPDQWTDANYGQPYGCMRVRPLRDVSGGLLVGGRKLAGWVSLGLLATAGAIVESAIVPDLFEGGQPDDNPYPEDVLFDWSLLG